MGDHTDIVLGLRIELYSSPDDNYASDALTEQQLVCPCVVLKQALYRPFLRWMQYLTEPRQAQSNDPAPGNRCN